MDNKLINISQESFDKFKAFPSEKCIFCNNKIEEIGGFRIIAQQSTGVILCTKDQLERNSNDLCQFIKLDDKKDRYVLIWDTYNKWTQIKKNYAINEFLKEHHPWFCQFCGRKICSNCGSVMNYPMGSDILDKNGFSHHCAMFPFDPGCNNPNCNKYRQLNINQFKK